MNKLTEILTIVIISSSVFVLMDNAKRTYRQESPAVVINTAPPAAQAPAAAPVAPVQPVAAPASVTTADFRDALRDIEEESAYVDGSGPIQEAEREAYLSDAGENGDLAVSAVFGGRAAAGRAMAAEVKRLNAGGRPVLFSSLLREASGGFFYIVRSERPAPAAAATAASVRDQRYIESAKAAATRVENECLETIWNGRN